MGNRNKETPYVCENDLFYQAPIKFIDQYFTDGIDTSLKYNYVWPSHIIIFEVLENEVKEILSKKGYVECKRFFNSHWHDDERRRGDVVVFCSIE